MKKQYLISLLGLIAIFIPFGSSLLNSSTKPLSYSTKEDAPSGTGLSVTDNSNITFWDIKDEDGNQTYNEPKSFTFEIQFDANTKKGRYHLPSNTEKYGLKLYNTNTEDDKSIEYSYNQLCYFYTNDNGPAEINPNGNDIWTYTIEEKEYQNDFSYFGNDISKTDMNFYITANYIMTSFNEVPREQVEEEPIGDVSTKFVSDAKDTTVEEVGEVNVTSSTDANVSYEITPGKDVYGETVTTTKVEWIDTSGSTETTLAIQEEKEISEPLKATEATEGVGLEPNKHYENTIIRATMSDGTTWETDVEPFDTCIPTFKDPTAILIDPANNMLEIKGEIVMNGLSKEEITIQLNKDNEPVSTNIIKLEEVNVDGEPIIKYDISYDEYLWESPTNPININDRKDNVGETINAYSLEIVYTSTLKDNEQKTADKYELSTFKNNAQMTRDEDLSSLKPDTSSIKFEPGEIAGITIGVLFVAGFILAGTIILIGNILFKRIEN